MTFLRKILKSFLKGFQKLTLLSIATANADILGMLLTVFPQLYNSFQLETFCQTRPGHS